VSPYVRTVRTASGATAVQIVHSSRRGSRDIEHIGSAHDEAQLEVLKAAARQRLAAGQDELGLGLERTEPARRGRAAVPADHVVADPPGRRMASGEYRGRGNCRPVRVVGRGGLVVVVVVVQAGIFSGRRGNGRWHHRAGDAFILAALQHSGA
jgi:hypothetical protein